MFTRSYVLNEQCIFLHDGHIIHIHHCCSTFACLLSEHTMQVYSCSGDRVRKVTWTASQVNEVR